MASEWHYLKDGQQVGPVSTERLKELAAAGGLKPADLVWRPGLAEWVAASRFKDLFPRAMTVPPPIPVGGASAEGSPISLGGDAGKGNKISVALIVIGAMLLVVFFTPFFYVSVKAGSNKASSLTFGFHLWYGITALVIGIAIAIVAALNLLFSRVKIVGFIANWLNFFLCLSLAMCVLVGTVRNSCEIGMSVYIEEYKERVPLSDIPRAESQCIPITAPLLIVFAGVGLILAMKSLRKSLDAAFSDAPGLSARDIFTRISMMVVCGLLFACFFLPLFDVRLDVGSDARHSFTLGSQLWYVIVVLVLSCLGFLAAGTDLVCYRFAVVPWVTRWVHLGVYLAALICSVVGVALSLCKIGMSFYDKSYERSFSLSELPSRLHIKEAMCIPVMAPLLVLVSLFGVVLALKALRWKKAAGTPAE